MEHLMTTERHVIQWFLDENKQWMNAGELKEYENSLDCALATLLECEKRGIDYPVSYERIKSAVQEPGEFWDACVKEAYVKVGCPDPASAGMLIALHALATSTGIDWLLEGFQDGL
jgi:hypothetical protein